MSEAQHRKQPATDRMEHPERHPGKWFSFLSRQLLDYAHQGLRKSEFIREALLLFSNASGCDVVGIRLAGRGGLTCFEHRQEEDQPFRYYHVPGSRDGSGRVVPNEESVTDLEWLCREIGRGGSHIVKRNSTAAGSFWTGDTSKAIMLDENVRGLSGGHILRIDGEFRSLAVIPFKVTQNDTGLLMFQSRRLDFFTRSQIEFYEEIAQVLGMAIDYRQAQIALRERVKELTCLFGIARLSAKPDLELHGILQGTVELLPPGWLYPSIASSRIILDGERFTTRGFKEQYQRLSADIVVGGIVRGTVEVAYNKKMPDLDEGPFLKEERNLIDAVAREISIIVERRHASEERERLQEQLRHADRLATIGQLAAGVAHELNEPISGILGFAQLASKVPRIPDQVSQDLDKIIAASLHTREVIMKLMLFARQTPAKTQRTDLNAVVVDGLFFFESRCAKAGIRLVRDLDQDLPQITADQSQLHQVLVNLVVNAIQAMPEGGRLTIRTRSRDDSVDLIVEDSGIGMDEEVLVNLFNPFYTTKDVNEGTGLGLSVVHGIVSSHNGTVSVESKQGEGSKFTVTLPSK